MRFILVLFIGVLVAGVLSALGILGNRPKAVMEALLMHSEKSGTIVRLSSSEIYNNDRRVFVLDLDTGASEPEKIMYNGTALEESG